MESWKPKMNYCRHKQYSYKVACKRHPKHMQSSGVCSICLSEKLSELTNNNNISKGSKVFANSPSSSSSSSDISTLSSSNASSYSSPMANSRRISVGSRDQSGKSKRVFKSNEVLKKSRSMAAFFFHRRKDEDESYENKIEMKRGFWSKLLLPRRRNKMLMHSKTTRERVIAAAYY